MRHPKEGLIAFDPKILKHLEISPCDIYAELFSGKIIKICEKNNLIYQDLIDRCMDESTIKVYMSKEGHKELMKSLVHSKHLHYAKQEEIEKAPHYVERGRKFGIQASSIRIVRGYIQSFGISDKLVELADRTIDDALNTIESFPNIKFFLEDLISKGDFFVKKSLLMSYLTIFALAKLGVTEKEKISAIGLACLLHDFSLENCECLKIEMSKVSVERLKSSSKSLIKNFEIHAREEAFQLSEVGNISEETVNIVKFHHEPLTSHTDVFGESAQHLTQHSQVFNIAHELAIFLILYGASKKNYSDFYYRISHKILPEYKKSLKPFGQLL